MASRRRPARIEPTFDAPSHRAAEAEFSLSEEDRVVPSRKSSRRAAGKSAGSRKPAASRDAAPRSRKRQRRRSGGLWGLIRGAAYWGIVLAIWAGIGLAGIVAFYGAQMPSATTWAIPDRPPNVRILAVDGTLVANRGMTGGQAVGLHEMSPYIPQAVMAIEDRRFYSHFGIDPIGLTRAMVENVTTGRFSQGGSTITQQLAKNLFLKPDRTIGRKVQEALLAVWLEQKHSKDQILEMYLNRVYFGSGSYGVEAASRRYFNKPASDVTLPEAALLAGLLKAPSRLSPARDPKAAETRAQTVLHAMRGAGMIGDGELTTAMSAPATRAAAYWTGSEHYVADKVMEELPLLIGEIASDVLVHTTVDLSLQELAERSLRTLVRDNRDKHDVSQGALVSIAGDGAVRAMVGGYDYANSQFDRASEARRQPGSAFKPFVFMAALEQGLTPDTIRSDTPVRIGKWQPGNFNDKFYGDVTLTDALARSLNSVAVRLTQEAGVRNVIETAYRMGVESDLANNASIALGTSEVTPLELTAAFVPFANGGYRPFVHFIDKVTTPAGKVIYERRSGGIPRVANARVIAMMNHMMARTLEMGTGRKAAFGWPAAGKTGTSQNSRDAWFVGYTAELTTGVWFGNDDGRPMKAITGGSLPALAWNEFMAAAHAGLKVRDLPGAGDAFPQADVPVAGQWPEDEIGRRISQDSTASIAQPVPPAEVGGQRGPLTSILDILSGN